LTRNAKFATVHDKVLDVTEGKCDCEVAYKISVFSFIVLEFSFQAPLPIVVVLENV
jgi:hypothetical protein